MAKALGYSVSNIMKMPYDDTSETMPTLAAQECVVWKNEGKYYLCFSPDGIVKTAVELGIV